MIAVLGQGTSIFRKTAEVTIPQLSRGSDQLETMADIFFSRCKSRAKVMARLFCLTTLKMTAHFHQNPRMVTKRSERCRCHRARLTSKVNIRMTISG